MSQRLIIYVLLLIYSVFCCPLGLFVGLAAVARTRCLTGFPLTVHYVSCDAVTTKKKKKTFLLHDEFANGAIFYHHYVKLALMNTCRCQCRTQCVSVWC